MGGKKGDKGKGVSGSRGQVLKRVTGVKEVKDVKKKKR